MTLRLSPLRTRYCLTSSGSGSSSDLDRGLLGHLFNGYSTKYVKTDMRKSARTPRVKAMGVKAKARAPVDAVAGSPA